MKLKNRKTGEIKDVCEVLDMKQEDGVLYKYYSLAELNEEWTDYEEPKEYWYIDYDGGIFCSEPDNSSTEKKMISMGNQFESREEAELAVRKLKAWKRLKDKVKFKGWQDIANPEVIWVGIDADHLTEQDQADLDLLFGGEE